MSTSRRPKALVRTAVVSALAGGALLIPAASSFAATPSVEPVRTESPVLLAAGGGVAAAGAAGLGFAMMRRGRTDG